MKKAIRSVIIMIFVFLITLLFFAFLQSSDNKYTVKQPIGQEGLLYLSENDLNRGVPIFLIDGWIIRMNGAEKTTYIGEYSNYRQTGLSASPAGEALYSLTLNYRGEEMIAAVTFPELISEFELYINGQIADRGKGNAEAVFVLSSGNTLIQLKIKSDSGYYSGMYFPGAISTPKTIERMQMIKNLCYLAALTMTLTLAVFSFSLWKDKKHSLYRLFGMFCLSFCLYISYHFVHLFHLSFEEHWYFIEDMAFYFMGYFMMRLNMVCARIDDRAYLHIVRTTGIVFPIISAVLYWLIPLFPAAVNMHGILQDIYRVLIFLWLFGISIYAAITKAKEYWYLLLGNMIFGIGLLINFLFSNRFEPIYTFWQFEWCGIYLVLIFAAMMAKRNKRILNENLLLTETLEDQVAIRTQKLNSLLEERREFFYQLAHNLKAPITATYHYIQLIKSHHVDVDEELARYIDLINEKQSEMTSRIETINALSQLDKIKNDPEVININSLVEEIYHGFKPEADVLTIYLKLNLEPSNECILAQKEKLIILMENLVCNAFSFTPAEGSVTLSTQFTESQAMISVEDTGCGIEDSKIPYLFNRFYVGRENQKEGSGLGLYIVKLIAEEFDGTVSVSSVVGKGSLFSVTFPLI